MKKLLAALKPYFSLLLFLIPIAVGAGLLYWAANNKSSLKKLPVKEVARKLRVLEVEPITIIPRSIGYGESSAAKSFQAVAEVKGKIIELHPELKSGSFIRQGDLLVAIDPKDIEISIEKLKSEISRSEANVQELNATQKNLESSIEIERTSLGLAKQELERIEKLEQSRAISSSEVDSQRRNVLAQQQSVQNLQSSLNLLPSQIKSAEASIAVSEANLAASQRDLERCRITAPFDCRLGSVSLDMDEVVSVGQQLFMAQAIDKIEIEAQFGIDKLVNVVRPESEPPRLTREISANPQELLRNFFDVDVVVTYGSGKTQTSRTANFERLREQVDSQARTVGIVVSVNMPYERRGTAAETGPPPVPGTYCEVELRGKPIENSFVVPRSAIRNGMIFLVDQDNRLRRKTDFETLLIQDNFIAVSGLKPGDRIVVSDPTPAIEEMLVDPQVDRELAEAIKAEAGGEK